MTPLSEQEQIAQACAARRGQPPEAWHKAMEIDDWDGFTSNQKNVLLTHSPSPEALIRLIQAPGFCPCGLKSLFAEVDQSPYTLEDWLCALDSFALWLEARGQPHPGFTTLLGYLNCCAEVATTAPAGFPLESILEQMLEDYGFFPPSEA